LVQAEHHQPENRPEVAAVWPRPDRHATDDHPYRHQSKKQHSLARKPCARPGRFYAVSSTSMNPNITVPMVRRDLPPMPIFRGNALVSFLSVMLFPDSVEPGGMAEQLTARLLLGDLQETFAKGIPVDTRFMAEIIADVRNGPDAKTFQQRRYGASAAGQIIKVYYAMITDPDPRVRDRANMTEAIEQAERVIEPRRGPGRPRSLSRKRGAGSSLRRYLGQFRRSLHMCAAFEMAGDPRFRRPLTIDGLMANSMLIYRMLQAWRVTHPDTSDHGYLDLNAEVFWRWEGMSFDRSHGTPLLALGFDRLTPRGTPGRPRK